jgi:hypothetical protein
MNKKQRSKLNRLLIICGVCGRSSAHRVTDQLNDTMVEGLIHFIEDDLVKVCPWGEESSRLELDCRDRVPSTKLNFNN